MKNIFLDSEEQGIVVFRFMQSLEYSKRMMISFGLLIVGFILQYLTGDWYAGVIFILLGNLLLLVKGFDNRINFKTYDPSANWERVEKSKILELERLDRKIKKWDLAAIDITNPLGAFLFIMLLALIGGLYFWGIIISNQWLKILSVDIAVLFIPHWVTGVRKVLRKPKLILKIKKMKKLVMDMEPQLKDIAINFLLLMKNTKTPIPDDIKFKVDFGGQDPDFLGLYGQVVINMVKSTAYPYFYVVIVTRKNYGLENYFRDYIPPKDVTKEFKAQKEVDVIVIRQTTSEQSGYHTNDLTIKKIFLEGYNLGQKVAYKQ